MTNKIDDPFKSVYASKTAQSVWNDLKELKQLRPIRWIWELLQNASDASLSGDNYLIAEVKYRRGKLIFSHNGCSFEELEVAHLIASGSTKYEDDESIGEFGTGFLTTHLLSLEIEILGQLNDGRKFAFPLVRDMRSRIDLYESMKQAEKDFKNSLNGPKTLVPQPFTTQFIYPIKDNAVSVVEAGIKTLEQCALYVVIFNKKFDYIKIDIDIKECRKMLSLKAIPPSELGDSPIQQIKVVADQNGNLQEKEYLLARSQNGTSVAVPLESNRDTRECLSVKKDIPRIFKVFPLIGTESFSFPAVINNSSDFMPTVARDDVPLGKSNDDVNAKNRAVIEEACGLLIRLLEDAASKGWHHTYCWAEIPPIQENEWLRECIKDKFIKNIFQISVVLTESDKAIAPKEAVLPLVENDEGVTELWDLLNDLHEYHEKLPRKDEAKGWCKTIKSWAKVNECEVSDLPDAGVIDGGKLASNIENKCSSFRDLQSSLQENVCAVDWLNRLYKFFEIYEINAVIDDYALIPDQNGEFDLLDNLSCDKDIDDKLKETAELLDRPLRGELRDIRLTSLEQKTGAGDLDNEDIVKDLIDKLQECSDNNPDNNFKKASSLLFAWIVNRKDYIRLRSFPMFAEEANSDELTIIHLPHPTEDNAHDNERPLAPVPSWANDLQDYSELFPRQHTLANVFFEAVPDPNIWQTLEEEGLIRKNVIIRDCREISFEALQSRDPLTEEVDHDSEKKIIVTNIAFLTKKNIGIIDRVRKSRPLAYKFWRFLTKWLIVHDSEGVKTMNEACTCQETHRFYPAQWLKPVVDRKWVPLGEGKADVVKPETLATLLRGNNWDPSSLSENHPVAKLLEAIGIARFDLIRQAAAKNDDTRVAVDNAFIEMLAKTGGNVSDLNHAVEYIEALKYDKDLPDVLAERRERKRIVRENQDLGQQVENLVKENLEQKNFEGKGFTVERTGKGSDFEMEDTEGITRLNVAQEDRKWLIEVKATRTEGDHQSVRMTSTQAQTAVSEKEKFLLCVVPIGQKDATRETVRENMYFIQNIGDSIAPLWKGLKSLKKKSTNLDIILDIEEGKAGILVKKSVWNSNGFPLEELAEHLSNSD